MASEVGMSEFARRLTPQQTLELESALVRGQGLAMYSDSRGARTVFTFGTRDSDIVGLPPRLYGGGELEQFVNPLPQATTMKSPLLTNREEIPQIHQPRVAPFRTEYPEVLLSGRTSSHPRGNSEFITPLLPSPRPEAVQPSEPVSEEVAWWRDHL